MEGSNMDMGGPSPTGTTGDSRWNPTKEQISMLDSLYRQGITTPSADQIQQITSWLKVYGSIECKNVFYWFQNHKARQRQKQKPENMAFINRYLHRTQPIYPPTGPNVVSGPCFLPEADIEFYPQCPRVLLHGGDKSRGRPKKMGKERFYGGATYDLVHEDNIMTMLPGIENYEGFLNNGNHETLALFPLHPTGVPERSETLMSPIGSTTSAGNSTITPPSFCETTNGIDQEGSGCKQHFDFFSCQGSSGSD